MHSKFERGFFRSIGASLLLDVFGMYVGFVFVFLIKLMIILFFDH